MGQAGDVLNSATFRTRLYEAMGMLVKTFKKKGWDDVCKCLAAAVEITENVEATSAYQAEQWVNSYLEDHPLATDDAWQEAVSISEPFIRNEDIHIAAGELRKHMRLLQQERNVTHVELCDCLKVSGYTRVTVVARTGGKVVSRSYWAKKRNSLKGLEKTFSKSKN